MNSTAVSSTSSSTNPHFNLAFHHSWKDLLRHCNAHPRVGARQSLGLPASAMPSNNEEQQHRYFEIDLLGLSAP